MADEKKLRNEPEQETGLSDGARQLAEQIRGQGLAQPKQPPMMAQPQETVAGPEAQKGFTPAAEVMKSRMTKERLNRAMDTLTRYKAGKGHLESRLIEVEQWWKMRHWEWMQEKGAANDMRTASAWLFNVIISKHADGIQSIPEANILPREQADEETAKQLSQIVPCVLEENRFDEVYSETLWQKLKGGTGAWGVFWDKSKLNGLGDISIGKVNLLHLFWEPGISDIQHSANVFYVEAVDQDLLKQMYPQLKDDAVVENRAVSVRKYITDDPVNDDRKTMVVDWYYHQYEGQKKILHFCKFVGDKVLYCTEDDPELAGRGLYDHGMYPFVLDALFPVEGSPCGFGYIDVCKNAQEQIDILNQAIVRNALINAIPRYFVRSDGSVNEEEFMDWTRPVIHVNGNLGSDSITPVVPTSLNGNVIQLINNKITELKETSGNTDSSNGATSNSVTAASAIAALQEASGKVSRASTMSAYRAFQRVIGLVIELIRQFYDMPRKFRIVGDQGQNEYMAFSNAQMGPQPQGNDFGIDMGYRLPVFDIKVEPQTKTAYSKNSQNELALSLYGNGIFNPQNTDQALMLLDMMEFEGKDELRQKVAQNGTLLQQVAMYQQMAMQLAQQVDPALAEQIGQTIMAGAGQMGGAAMGGEVQMPEQDKGTTGEITKLNKARARAQQTAQVGQ